MQTCANDTPAPPPPEQQTPTSPTPELSPGLGEAIPLSFAQQRLWFLAQLEGDSPVYNVPLSIGLSGPVQRDALQAALDQLVARHDSLRTRFVNEGGTPVQRVRDELKISIIEVKLNGVSAPRRDQDLEKLLCEDARRPFDLARDPLIRATLYCLEEEEHVLLFNLHHIICDEWSLRILVRDFAQLYDAFVQGRPPRLPELPIQYTDYALWQRDWLQGPILAKQLDYWKQRLKEATPPLPWPGVDHAGPIQSDYSGRRRIVTLPDRLSTDLRELSRRERATLFMTLLASFKALLHRCTGQDSITVGSPIAGRTRVETEELIGFFVNTLVLRTDLTGPVTFLELLKRVRETTLGAYDHQDLPFERIVEELHPERQQSRTPFLQIVFAFEQPPPAPITLGELQLQLTETDTRTAKFDLTCVVRDHGDGLAICVEYSTAIFADETIDRMLAHWKRLLEGIAADPDRPISLLPLVTEEERRRAIVDWNETRRPYPDGSNVASLFEEQVRRRPDALAVRYGTEGLTYGELNIRANRLAHALRQSGVGPNTLVAVCAEPCVGFIIGLVAVVKTGGGYVPLDPSHPPDRLALILEDTEAPVILVQDGLGDRLPVTKGRCIGLDSFLPDAGADSNLPLSITPDSVIYVIYTSGSTGRPKGVLVPHRAVVRLVCNTDYIDLGPADRVAQASNVAFDAATFEIWGALLNGAVLIGINRDVALSSQALAGMLVAEAVSTLFLTTALFNQVAADAPQAFQPLKSLLFGGEAVDPKAVARVLKHGAPDRLLHVYGPTEATTFASWHHVTHVPSAAKTIPIGRPIANTTLYILDPNLSPVPVGIPGEIFVGGPGVARGYLHAPELSAEKFVSDPFSGVPGSKLYKTGDRACYRTDGNIVFLGRFDGQVKVRGFRVELAEIEAAIASHPQVRESIVVARDTPAGKTLNGYVVLREGDADGAINDLRQFIKQKLPSYMVPASLTPLPSLPLNLNGKVDRNALPNPDSARPDLPGNFVAPRTSLEGKLAALWSEILGVEQIGVQDNFFDLGGHSMLAVRLFAQIESRFGKKLPLASLFQSPTVEQLSRLIRTEESGTLWPLIVDIQPLGSNPPFFWMHSLGGDGGGAFFYYRKLAQLLGPNQPSFGIRSPQEPFTGIQEMAGHYVDELLKVQPEGPYFLGGFCFGGVVAYEMACQLHARGQVIGLLALLESAPPTRGRGKLTWRPGAAASLARNMHAWAGDLLQQGPAGIWQRLHRKVKVLSSRVRHRFAPVTAPDEAPELGDLIDMSEYPKDYIRYARAHWQALRSYRPRPYAGRVTLFRARKQPLLSLDSTLGWGDLAKGGVAINVIPGTHEKMLEEPNVHILVAGLKACLVEAQAVKGTPAIRPR